METEDFYAKHIGEVYGRLTIKGVVRNPKPKFVCDCSCGNETISDVHSILSGKTQSCRCLQKELIKENGKNNLKPAVAIGEKFRNTKGLTFEIVEYVRSHKVKVRFVESGFEVWSAVKEIKKGSIRDWIATPLLPKPAYVRTSNRARKSAVEVGQVYTNSLGSSYEVTEILPDAMCRIKFLDSFGYEKTVKRNDAKKGVRNPYHRVVAGVGYVGEGEYTADKNRKVFTLWSNMLVRCYDEESLLKQPTYLGCTVVEKWHCFQNFARWCLNNKTYIDNPDWCLDKDVLVKGNKIYSEETCAFVPRDINNMFTLRVRKRGDCPVGVHWDSTKEKYVAQVNKNKSRKFLGYFDNPISAFNVYKKAKEAYIKEVAEVWKEKIDYPVYTSLLNWTIEVTD